jgi:MFS family permease
MFGAGLLGPLFAIFAERIGGNVLDITSAWAIYMIVTGLLTMVVGRIGDKVGHQRLVITGYTLTTIFTFSYLLVSEPIHLFLVQGGLGVALALSNPTWAALYDKYSDDSHDGYIWGSAMGQGNIATGIAALLGGLIVTYFSFEALFVLMTIMHASATFVQLRFKTA